jgi:rfaE bifunctional protein nucleotidyltransferase chain/domain
MFESCHCYNKGLYPNPKILGREQLQSRVADWRRNGEPIILGNGCFDLLHVGHIRYLEAAKALGGRLIVAVNSDASVRALKGEGRPLMPEHERAEIISSLAAVDAVVVFGEPDVSALIRELRPDIQVKGTDYSRETVPERDIVISCGGRVEIVGDPKDHSTTSIIRSQANFANSPGAQRAGITDAKQY